MADSSMESSSFKELDKNAKSSTEVTPLPRKEMTIISMLLVGTGAFYSSLNVLMVYMVQSYGIAKEPSQIGSYTGWMTAMYMLGQLCTSLFWGWISDRTGRKPWLITAEVVSCAMGTSLAFCQSYHVACAILFVYGFFHSTVVVTKSTIAELCDKTNQSLAFGIVLVTFGLGSTVGPLVGGLLAQPCSKGLVQSCPPFLNSYPFALPFLLFSGLNLVNACFTFFLRETSPGGKRARQLVPLMDEEAAVLKSVASGRLQVPKSLLSFTGNSAAEKVRLLVRHQELTGGNDGQAGTVSESAVLADGKEDLSTPLLPIAPSSIRLLNRNITLVSITFGLVFFIFLYGDPLFSIYAAAPAAIGGLGYDSSVMGVLGSLYGVTMCLYTLFLFPLLNRALGPLRCMQLCLAVYIIVWPLAPAIARLHPHPFLQLTAVLCFKVVRVVCGCTGYTASMMLVSNAATSASQGLVVGLSTTVGALLGSPAPALAGWLWSTSSSAAFPLHYLAPWVVPSGVAFLGVIVSLFISV